MKKGFGPSGLPLGFSLAEVLAALTIGAMVLVAILGIYGRAERSAAAVIRKLDSSRLPSEVVQRIAEDLDRAISVGSGTKVTIENKFDNGFPTARMTILKTFHDSRNREQTFEEIIWQSGYDFEGDSGSLVLYRSYDGIALEDKLLDEQRESWEKGYSFVPICTGVTFFRIQVPRGEKVLDGWTADLLPDGITVTISFAEPFKTVRGTLDVPDEAKIMRTIAVDRTRKIRFEIVPQESDEGEGLERAPDEETLPLDSDEEPKKSNGQEKSK